MIRINLLADPKQKRGKRASAPAAVSVPGEGPNILTVAVVVGLMGLAGNGYYYWKLNHDHEVLVKEMAAAEAENRRLATVKAKFQEAEKQKEQYRRRLDVIDQLRNNQMGPVQLLTTIGDTVNDTDAVWLMTMKEENNNVSIDGMALSANAVANLMANLEKTGYFKSVEMKETLQDDRSKDVQAFTFSLTCEKMPPKPAQPAAPAGQAAQPQPSKS
jgi:Tfp pilus assembly protein PilN